jgi:hypothetical protein
MLAKWAKLGKTTRAQWQPLWIEYVKAHLLPRLYAFELMMAPYAIAHMKIGLKLADTGYTFPEDGPRVNVFLTNALEPAHAINPGLEFEAPMLAHEAAAANRVKEQLAATVVVGNPPYSGGTRTSDSQSLISMGIPTLASPSKLIKTCLKFRRELQSPLAQSVVPKTRYFGMSIYLDCVNRSMNNLEGF